MAHHTLLATAALSLGLTAVSAFASSISIDAQGGPVVLQSGDMPGLFDGPINNDFAQSDVDGLLSSISAGGIATDGLVTFILLDTGDGITFLGLVDSNLADRGDDGSLNSLGMSTTAPGTANHWVNDLGKDITGFSNPFGTTVTAFGDFNSPDGDTGDGFAWSNLQLGDSGTFNFTSIGNGAAAARGADGGIGGFQFLTMTPDGWRVVDTGQFTKDGQFAFSFTIIPLPAAFLLGVTGLLGTAVLRRRVLR